MLDARCLMLDGLKMDPAQRVSGAATPLPLDAGNLMLDA
jgi:hypothetical protein